MLNNFRKLQEIRRERQFMNDTKKSELLNGSHRGASDCLALDSDYSRNLLIVNSCIPPYTTASL